MKAQKLEENRELLPDQRGSSETPMFVTHVTP